ncbi:MAG TPA: sigma-54 dependent transcriptional regulator [Planctomycetota bacterium]|nr:sigma-54 dependent transcriptional regulator [Planctomycetota bacterium]
MPQCHVCGLQIPSAYLADGRASLSGSLAFCSSCQRQTAPSSSPSLPAVSDPARRLIGATPEIDRVRTLIRRFGPLDVPVLITGETGTGKELVARALHDSSPAATKPFVAVNCGAVALSLLESELFGYERGAFTGATRSHTGYFEQAGGGTLLLDEIGDIAQQLQVALLRVLETGEIRPVGAKAPRKISCRIVAATNADLEERARRGEFRLDLLYRLQRVRIHIPPLRERSGDILPLVESFFERWRKGQRCGVTPELRALLTRYEWPGNVRELRNVIEQMVLAFPHCSHFSLPELDPRLLQPSQSFSARPPVQRPPADARSVSSPADGLERTPVLVEPGRSRLRRLQKIRQLFSAHSALTRAELVRALGASNNTLTSDLKILCEEGFIRRIEPSASPRSVYFQLAERLTSA